MAIQSKNHRPSGVDSVRVSEGSREMSRAPVLKFADLDQERGWYLAEKLKIQGQFSALKEDIAHQLQHASYSAAGAADWMGKKSAIESDHQCRRRELGKNLEATEQCLASVNLRIKQRDLRDLHLMKERVTESRKTVDGSYYRADGSVDLGFAVVAVLRELHGLREDLKAFGIRPIPPTTE